MGTQTDQHPSGTRQPHFGGGTVTIEAMSEALSATQETDGGSEQVIFSYWDKCSLWEFSDDGGLTWHHLVEGDLCGGILANRLQAVLSGRGDSGAWEDEDGSDLVVREAEIGIVSRHVSGGYRLALLTHVSGEHAAADAVHECPAVLAETAFAAARGDRTEVNDADAVVALESASRVGMAATAKAYLDIVADGLIDAAWDGYESAAWQAVPLLLAQLSDGRWRAKLIGELAVISDPDDDINLNLETESPWFDFPDDDRVTAVMDYLVNWRLPDETEERTGDEDQDDGAGALGHDDLDESDAPSSDWRALMQTRADLLSIRTDLRDGSSPTASETDQRVLRALDVLLAAPAWVPLDELFDGLAELAQRLNGPLLGAGCDPDDRLRDTVADLLDRMEATCLVGLTALAASSLVPLDATSEPGAGLQADLLGVVDDAARSDVGRFGPDCAKWRQAAEDLRRDLHQESSGRHRTDEPSERTTTLARKLLAKSGDVLGSASSLVPEPLQLPSSAELGFDILGQERGWRPTPTGRWRLGDDERLPRLMAGSDNANSPPSLLVMPPIEGPLMGTWQIPSYWEKEMYSHGATSVLVAPLRDAFSTCPECMCPLPERTARQTCPSCGGQVDTFAMSQAIKSLDVASALFETEEEAARAAVEVSGSFRAWLLTLTARIA